MTRLANALLLPFRHHLVGSLLIVVVVAVVIGLQVSDRRNFADSELHEDVAERWGAPIVQPAPSVRFVPSGTVFTTLEALPLSRQDVTVNAAMSYRKRGLVYFSGFDFAFRGDYAATNDQGVDVDVAFVFPINLERNKVLLSDLEFSVNGAPEEAHLPPGSDKLLWTGRIAAGEKVDFHVAFRGRGLDSFVYVLDPAAPVRDFQLSMDITGGDNFDYPEGVVPAASPEAADGHVKLVWRYASLESGIPVGAILPSEKSFDALIATMLRRSWAPFLLLFAGLLAISLRESRPLRFYEAYLVAAAYGLFFVLLAYLAAFMDFHLAWVLSTLFVTGLILAYVRAVVSPRAARLLLAPLAGSLVIPTLAVILQGYTGLIYTLEIAALVATGMYLTTRDAFRELVDRIADIGAAPLAQGDHHA